MSTDSERRVRELVRAATDDIEPSPELDGRIRAIPATAPRRPHRLAAAAVAVLAVVAAAIVWVGVGADDSQDVTPAEHAPTTSIPAFPTDRWTPLARPPVPVSSRAAVGVPGGAVFWELSDQDGSTDDKYAYLWHLDLATDEWTVAAHGARRVPPGTVRWGVGDTIWTGDRVIALMYPSTTNEGRIAQLFETVSWTPGDSEVERVASLEMPADLTGAHPYAVRLVATGQGVAALISVQTSTGESRTSVWSLDLDADSWRRLPDLPTTSDRVFSIDWTGEELVVLAGRPTPMATYYDGLDLFRLRPGDSTWREAARPPDASELSGQAADAAWDGRRLVVVSYAPSAATWDPSTDTWSALPMPPIDAAEDYPRVQTSADGTVIASLGVDAARLDRGGSTWTPLPASDLTATVATDGALVGMGPTYESGPQTLSAIGF